MYRFVLFLMPIIYNKYFFKKINPISDIKPTYDYCLKIVLEHLKIKSIFQP
jgi:hypothetical protein